MPILNKESSCDLCNQFNVKMLSGCLFATLDHQSVALFEGNENFRSQ